MECCGQTYSSNSALRRHVNNKHTPSGSIYRCFAENCGKNFRVKLSFDRHQQTHHYVSDQFQLMTQAFQGTTLILRKKLENQGIYMVWILYRTPKQNWKCQKYLTVRFARKMQSFSN